MLSSRLPEVAPIYPSFTKHRFDSDPYRFSLRLSPPNFVPATSWPSLPSPPMSGSPPVERPPEPTQIAGRRRKRSESPPAHYSPPSGLGEIASASRPADRPAESSARQELAPIVGIPNPQAPAWHPTMSTAPPFAYGSLPPPTAGPSTFPPPYAPAQAPVRGTRKTKVHVPAACVNCKKKHLRCDNSRPCHRCTQSGKEASCVDVQHKKRGRPPLKPEDTTTRGYPSIDINRLTHGSDMPIPSSQVEHGGHQALHSPPTLTPRPNALAPQSRRIDQRRPNVPLAPNLRGYYATPSIQPTYATAAGTMYQPGAGRPHSRGSSSIASSHPTSPFYITQSSGTTPDMTGTGVANLSQTHASPANSRYQTTGPPPYQNPIFPRTNAPLEAPILGYPHSHVHPPPTYTHPGPQLPPIQQAPPGRYGIPAIAQHQQRQAQQAQHIQQVQQVPQSQGRELRPAATSGASGSGDRPPDAKRPRMSVGNIVNPRND